MYNRTTRTAFAAVSALAEAYDGGSSRLSAVEIARRRGLQLPFVAKVLTSLSQSGLVQGMRGPGGGFTLTMAPSKIRLIDVFRVFEPLAQQDACPFGGGVCGARSKCPLHDQFAEVRESISAILHDTTFEAFHGGRA